MVINKIWLVELIVWSFVLFCGFSYFVYKTAIKDNFNNTYYIFFNDAGGLVKGSPVHLMGINIGYIKDVKIFDNKVFISILVTKKNVSIPKSATATIEFYGLGGSAFLELNPSTASENIHEEEIIPSKTYRVQDYWDGQKLTANTMIDMYTSLAKSIDKSDILHNKQVLFQSDFMKNIVNATQKINEKQTVIINKLSREKHD